MTLIKLPTANRTLEPFQVGQPNKLTIGEKPVLNRIAFSAAHVVADPLATSEPWLESAIDWEPTLAYRRYLWSLGLGVAEAMDTAQRGMGLEWSRSLELIKRSVDAAKDIPGAFLASGAGTDHLEPKPGVTVDDVIDAYEHQFDAIEKVGGRIIMMASRALAASARTPDDYVRVYGRLLSGAKEPVILHWLGEMFDPALTGYWGHFDHDLAMAVALEVIRANPTKVDGIKISLLNKQKEIDMRRQLPSGVKMYTGDDFNYAELIEGDGERHSHALLGIFDAIAPAAAAALAALARNDTGTFRDILEPTVPLSRHIFGAPTRFYKTGVVFLAWLNGHQSHFVMIGGQQSARHIVHLAEAFRLASRAGLLRDPALACSRMQALLEVNGVGK